MSRPRDAAQGRAGSRTSARTISSAAQDRGMLFAHPCGCGTLYSGLDFCQHGNRYEHHDPPETDAVTKMQRLEGWLRSRGVTTSG